MSVAFWLALGDAIVFVLYIAVMVVAFRKIAKMAGPWLAMLRPPK